MKTTPLTEQVADWQEHLQVDHHHRLVRNVALTGLISKNGYRYAPDALRQAVSLYEHKPVFLDHAPDGSRPQVRSTRDLVGTIVSPRFEQGRIRGDIRTLDTESGRLFLTLTASNAPGLGMSHVVLAERTTDEGDVTRIHDVISVDAVVFPATTTTFREAQRDPPQTPGVTATDGASPSADITRLREALDRRTEERDDLRQRLASLEAATAQSIDLQTVERLLQSAGLSAECTTASFRRHLSQADDPTRRELLHEHRSLLERLRQQQPVSLARTDIGDRGGDARFVAIVKRAR